MGAVRKTQESCSRKGVSRNFQCLEEELKRRGKLDFDDMVLKCHKLLTDRPDICKSWQEKGLRISWGMNFQDINPVQYDVLLWPCRKTTCLSWGDDDRSIYAFRGARPEIMLGFLKDYPDAGRYSWK